MPVHNNILWKAPRARGGCRYPANVKIETEHIDGIWYAGYVTAVRGEGAETRVLVKWPGTGAKRSKWFMLADAKVRHPLIGYSTARERDPTMTAEIPKRVEPRVHGTAQE